MALLSDARVAIHAALTAVMAWLAAVLVLPGNTFDTAKAFAVMERLGDESRWAMAFWFVASIGFAGLTTSSLSLRLISVLAVSTMHGVVALCFVLANPVNTGTGTYTILAGLGYYLAWRRSREGV